MDRREALHALGALGLGGIGAARDPDSRLLRVPSSSEPWRPPERSDGRVVELVLANASAWVPGEDENPGVEHGIHVRISGDRIVEVARSPLTGSDIVDLGGHLLFPGIISGHTHVAGGSSTRGIIEGGRSYARPLEIVENEFDDDELDALTTYNLAELIRSGCTSQVEMSLSLRQARSYARMAERLGARGWVGGMIPGIGRLFPIWFGSDQDLAAAEAETLAEIQANLDFARSLATGDGLVQGMMTPHAADTHTPVTLAAIAAAARELGTGIHTHLSQGGRETETVRRRWGVTPTRWLADAGLMDGPFFGAHFTAPDWSVDPAILVEHGGAYVTCPSAGGAGGATQPYPEALAAGMTVCVGIDTHSNDMMENLKLGVILGQARASLLAGRADAPPLRTPTADDAVLGSTQHAADVLRRPDLGRIEEGARADLVAVDLRGLLVGSGAAPREPLNNLLYANGTAVSWVLTDGRIQVSDGVFVADDVDRIVAEGGRVARRLWDLLAREDWFG